MKYDNFNNTGGNWSHGSGVKTNLVNHQSHTPKPQSHYDSKICAMSSNRTQPEIRGKYVLLEGNKIENPKGFPFTIFPSRSKNRLNIFVVRNYLIFLIIFKK